MNGIGVHDPRAGLPARVEGKWETIGPEACPLMVRRTLLAGRFGKLMIHRFFPGATDKDCHDHPASFVTIVVQGGYDDIQPDGTVDRLRAPAIRFRRAEHAHVTRVHARVGGWGAQTVVVMFRKRRPWGFWRDGRWFEWKTYERMFGLNWRCDP